MEKKAKIESLSEEIKKFTGFEKDTIREKYAEIAEKYEEVSNAVEYPDPKMCAELVESLNIPKDAEIFDMGCGTGFTGDFLAEKGYTRIAGVDASPEMLEIARRKNLYYELEELFLGSPDTFPDKYKAKFDVIVCNGVILHCHCGPEIFDEMLMALKTGGFAIFSTRAQFIDDNCQGRMDELTDLGKWELVKKYEFMRYPDEGIECFKPTRAYMFVYQKV